MTILNPRLLLVLVFLCSTGIWFFYEPMFAYEKYFSIEGFSHYFIFYALILASCFVTEKARLARPAEAGLERFRELHGDGSKLKKEAVLLAIVASGAQLLWIARMVLQEGVGPLVRMVLVEHDFLAFKHQVVNVTSISGITTLTQLGMIASALYSVYVFGLRGKGSFWLWALILFPGVLRGMFFSERIALLEVLIPIVTTAVLFGRIKVTVPKLIGAAGAFVLFFSAAEGLRSYQFYSKTGFAENGVYSYGLGRFLDYISSSVNHSMSMVDLSERTIGFPALLFNGWLNLLYEFVPQSAVRAFLHLNETTQAYLNVKSSPYSAADYTNMGYFGEIFADSGYLYVLYAILYGWFVGMAYKGTRRFQVGWMIIYPAVLFSLLESYRVHYLFDNRMFYPLLYIFARYLYFSYRERKSVRLVPAGEG